MQRSDCERQEFLHLLHGSATMSFLSKLTCCDPSAVYIVSPDESFHTLPSPPMQAAGAGSGQMAQPESTTASASASPSQSPFTSPNSSPEGSPAPRAQNTVWQDPRTTPWEETLACYDKLFSTVVLKQVVFDYLGADAIDTMAQSYLSPSQDSQSEPEYDQFLAQFINQYLARAVEWMRIRRRQPVARKICTAEHMGVTWKQPSPNYQRPVTEPIQSAFHLGGARVQLFTEKADTAAQKIEEAMQKVVAAVEVEVAWQETLLMMQEDQIVTDDDRLAVANIAQEAARVVAAKKAAANEATTAARFAKQTMKAAQRAHQALMEAVQPQPLRVAAHAVPFAQELDDTEDASDVSSLALDLSGISGNGAAVAMELYAPRAVAQPKFTFQQGGAAAAARVEEIDGAEAPPPSAEV